MKEKSNVDAGPQLQGSRARKNWLLPMLTVAFMLSGLQTATQYFAHQFQYQESLGLHIDHIYPPWSIYLWWKKWYSVHPDYFTTSASFGMLVVAVGLLTCLILKAISDNSEKPNRHLHGSARWATKKDILEAGLLGNDAGVYVGAWRDKRGKIHYLRHDGPEHILTYAPTRSGKGVGLVVPTLLSWPHSAVITDLKGELWAMTAGWRQKYAKNKVLRFEPAALSGCARWNPLDEIRINTEYEVGDVQNVATLIVDPDGKGLENHWQKTSQALLVGVILHVAYKARIEGTPATLSYVDRILSDPNQDIHALWDEMVGYGHVNGANHPVVGAAGRDMMDRPDEEAGSVLSSAKSYLALYRDPVVASNVSVSDFCIQDLMHHDDPVSLYIITQPNDKARLRPLVRIMMNMIVRLLASKMEFERVTIAIPKWRRVLAKLGYPQAAHSFVRSKKTYKHRLLGMIDEFPSLGKLEILQESLAFVAGYGIKFYLICQDINQLKSKETGYGQDETITSNCHIQNAYPPNRVETAEHLSKLTGQTTIVKSQITASGRRTGLFLGQVSRSHQEVQRSLLTVDECLRMPGPKKNAEGQIMRPGDMVVYVAGYPAIYGTQPLYFQDPIFTARAAVPEPDGSDTLRIIGEPALQGAGTGSMCVNEKNYTFERDSSHDIYRFRYWDDQVSDMNVDVMTNE